MPHLEDEFGDIVGKARNGLGLSLEQLSQSVAITVPVLRAMEECTHQPTAAEVQSLAQTLNLSPANLLAIAEESWTPEAWDPHHDPAAEVLRWAMPVGAYSVYCYLLRCRQTGAAAVIDTGGQGQRVVAELHQLQIQPELILVTHEHSDHIDGLPILQAKTNAKVLAGQAAKVSASEKLADGEIFALGALQITARNTPGHTAGCVTYHTGQTAFVGDTLFAGSAGRANYSYEALLHSIQHQIYTLDDSVHLFPGHGPVTTVGQEKRHNAFVAL